MLSAKCNLFLWQKEVLEAKEISSLLSTCKSVATAYHTYTDFARALHEAQCQVPIPFPLNSPLSLICCHIGDEEA